MANIILRLSLVAILAMMFGCKKPDDNGSLTVTMPTTNYILIDAKATSCKSKLSPTPTDDISALYTDIGKMTIGWAPPVPEAELRLIYIKIYPRSAGLSSQDPITIAGQDLNCIIKGNIDIEPTVTAAQTSIPFMYSYIFGNLTPTDATKRNRFNGRADVLVYAVLKVPGKADTPITGRSTFNFQFDGAY